jgi:tetratricopeptide (TPR) repeat protein
MRNLYLLLLLIIGSCEYSGKYLKTGDRYFQEANYPAAISEYAKAEAINPHNATIFLHRGKALERLGLFDSAAIDFQKNLTYDDRNAEAMGHLAWCWYSTTPPKREACRKQMKVALEIDPSLSELWYLSGRMHFHSNDLPKAELALKKAISLEKNYTDAMGLLARVLERSQRLVQAVPLVSKVLKLDPKNAEATHVAAEVSRSQNRKELARRQDQRAHFLDPSFPLPRESESTITTAVEAKPSESPPEAVVFHPVKPNPAGRIIPKEELSLPPLSEFLTAENSATFDTPNDSVFEQLLFRIIDSALLDSSLLANLPLDSAQKTEIIHSLSKEPLELKELDSTSFLSKTIQLQQQRANPASNLNFDSISAIVIADTALSAFEKGLWIRFWVKNHDYTIIKPLFKGSGFTNSLNLPNGSSELFLAVAHHRLEQPSLANHYFRMACKEIPLSPLLFNKEKVPIHR